MCVLSTKTWEYAYSVALAFVEELQCGRNTKQYEIMEQQIKQLVSSKAKHQYITCMGSIVSSDVVWSQSC